ncbi:hypothetical protein Tco_0410515 [Tanacetum coccineum]
MNWLKFTMLNSGAQLNELITYGAKLVQTDGSLKKPWMIDGARIPPNVSKLLPELLKPKSVEDVMRVGKMGWLGNGSITGNFALVQLERNFVQYINSLLQDSGTDFWGTGRFLAHTEKQVASHMDVLKVREILVEAPVSTLYLLNQRHRMQQIFFAGMTVSLVVVADPFIKGYGKTLLILSSDGNSWVPIPVTSPAETGTSTGTKMTVPSTAEEKTCKKNDVKARSLLLMALPNEHQLTLDQFVDAQSMFATIKARFGGNEATKKTQKALLKTTKVKKSAGASNDDKNLAFVTTSGSQLVHEDLEQLHDDDLEEMDLKWNYLEWKETHHLMEAILVDGLLDLNWGDMAEEEIQANMALMTFSDSEVTNDKSCSKSCLKNHEALKKQYNDLLVKLDDTGFKAATYKRGLATLEEQIIKYREHEVLFF